MPENPNNEINILNANNDLDFIHCLRANSRNLLSFEESPYANTQIFGSFYDLQSLSNSHNAANQLLFLNLNVQSLNSKHQNLKEFVSELESKSVKIGLIAMQEIWNIDDINVLNLDGFHPLIFKQRIGMRGGGVGFYVKENINFEIVEDLSFFDNKVFESLTLLLTLNSKKLYVTSLYRSNGVLPNVTQNEKLLKWWNEI